MAIITKLQTNYFLVENYKQAERVILKNPKIKGKMESLLLYLYSCNFVILVILKNTKITKLHIC